MSSTTTRDGTSAGGMLTGYRWLAIVNVLGIMVQAVLASQGIFAGHRDLITGHGQFGNLLFLLVIVQAFLAFRLAAAKVFPTWIVVFNAVQVILLVAQIGLGYSTRDDTSLVAWHIPNGVLLMGTCTALAALAWVRLDRQR